MLAGLCLANIWVMKVLHGENQFHAGELRGLRMENPHPEKEKRAVGWLQDLLRQAAAGWGEAPECTCSVVGGWSAGEENCEPGRALTYALENTTVEGEGREMQADVLLLFVLVCTAVLLVEDKDVWHLSVNRRRARCSQRKTLYHVMVWNLQVTERYGISIFKSAIYLYK